MQKIKEILKNNRNSVLISVFTIIVFIFTPLYNKFSQNYLDNSLKQAAISYAITRSINGAVSTLQQSSVTLGIGVEGTLAIGQTLDPVNNAVERFSDMIAISIWTLGSEKVLYEITKIKSFVIFIILLAFLNIFINSNILKNILVLLILLRIFTPISALISHYTDDNYFSIQIQKNLDNLKPVLKENKIDIKVKKDNSSWWQNKINSVKEFGNSISTIKEKIAFYTSNMNMIIESLMNLTTLYLSKFILNVLLLPLLFVYLVRSIKIKE